MKKVQVSKRTVVQGQLKDSQHCGPEEDRSSSSETQARLPSHCEDFKKKGNRRR